MLSEILNFPDEKLSEDARLIKNYFISLIRHMPNNVYWVDKNGITLGCNDNVLKFVGAKNLEDVVGKSYEEIAKTAGWTEKQAMSFKNDDQEVIRTGKPKINVEEPVFYDKEGKAIYYLSSRIPLFDENNKVVGIVGISVNIADQKEKEHLQLENEKQKVQLQAQEIFTKIAAQVVHDIKSPTASLLMLIKSCTDIPEKERIALREATMRVQDIANNLLNYYSQQENNFDEQKEEQREPVLVSALLPVLLSEKKMQYQDLHIKFEGQFSQKGNFAFISVQSSAVKRMLSNLINNGVDALENRQDGKVTVKLDADNEWVRIIIEDNGKGMSPQAIEKIRNNIAFTEGKQQGHGLGLTQVRETLQRNQGEFVIESEVGKGTKITLIFARIQAPVWIAEELTLAVDDIVIILDDDNSIHGAWDTHFEPILKEHPTLKLIHFTEGEKALQYIAVLSDTDKKKVFLLNDYELLKQDLTGLDVIEKSGIKRSILVTSHYANKVVRERAAEIGTKILPKLLASEIPIILKKTNEAVQEEQPANQIVVIDDDAMFLKVLTYKFLVKDYAVEGFHNPHHFLSRLAEFPKTTRICFDYDFNVPSFNGLDLAKVLHEQGYTKLYLLSGMNFKQADMPPYLTLIPKDKAVDMLDMI